MSEVNNESGASKIPQKSLQSLFLKEKLSPKSSVKKLIAVVSGKGGVGKSLVTSMLASGLSARNYNTAILDADMTGPSIPKSFGLKNQIFANEDQLMLPARTKSGISVMSINLLLKNETDPVLWKGPIISQSIKQFWSEAYWEDIAGYGRCTAYCISVTSRRRDSSCGKSAGTCINDSK